MLASPFQPDLDEWQHNLKLQIPRLDEHSFIITHGLGALSALKFLQQQDCPYQSRIGGVILVAAFDTPLVAWSELNQMVHTMRLDLKQVSQSSRCFVMLLSSNDPYVPAPISLRLAHTLKARIVEIRNAGHFRKTDGYADFPELLKLVKLCLANDLQNAAGL